MTQPDKAVVEAVARDVFSSSGVWASHDYGEKSYLVEGERRRLIEEARKFVAAHAKALEAAGFVVVPREPTEAMVEASKWACDDYEVQGHVGVAAYRAMIKGAEPDCPRCHQPPDECAC